jgi:hypothetical protein
VTTGGAAERHLPKTGCLPHDALPFDEGGADMKLKFRNLIGIAAAAWLMMGAPASAQDAKTFNGYLYSMLNAINTPDEEPVYYLQTFDNRDLLVLKRASKKNEDSALQEYVGKKVTIIGVEMNQTIDYQHIHKYEP